MSTELDQNAVRRLVDSRHVVSVGPGRAGGLQAVIRFDNGYGASIIRNAYSYGVELGVIRFTGPDPDEWDLNYDTPAGRVLEAPSQANGGPDA